ncbi:MAG: hypothetical protein KJ941_11335 [Bacteroidetes bacterium]|nr:hypothetical protein [Bacteroidota bacterium]
MKKILMLFVAATLVLGACSKEKKVNKRMDGSWTLMSENDAEITADKGVTVLTFEKDKKEGTGSVEYTDSKANKSTSTFEYTLDGNVLTTSTNSYTVVEYTKTDLTLLSTNGTFELKQKFKKN